MSANAFRTDHLTASWERARQREAIWRRNSLSTMARDAAGGDATLSIRMKPRAERGDGGAGFGVRLSGQSREKESLGWPAGFEPATSGTTTRRSNQLS